jgi:plastocyanin
MNASTSRPILLLCAALSLGIAVAACDEKPNTGRERMETEGAASDPARTGGSGVVSADPTEDPKAVVVKLSEYDVRMPTILTPGSHLFTVTNEGKEAHGLTVEGNGTSVSAPTPVQPGETQALPVDLAPGTYKVFCPLDGHRDRGMSVDVTVSE